MESPPPPVPARRKQPQPLDYGAYRASTTASPGRMVEHVRAEVRRRQVEEATIRSARYGRAGVVIAILLGLASLAVSLVGLWVDL